MSIDLEALGISKEDLQERVVERIADQVMRGYAYDEDGDSWRCDSKFKQKLDDEVKKRLDAAVAALAEKHVTPMVDGLVEGLVLQQTNQWGEKTGQPFTFIQYLISRAEAYMREDVNYEGKGKSEMNGYSFTKAGTRLAVMIDKKISHDISVAMNQAFTEANQELAKSLMETMRTRLNEILSKIRVEVKK